MKTRKVIYVGPFELPDNNAAALRVRGIEEILKFHGIDVSYIEITKSRNSSQPNQPNIKRIKSQTKTAQLIKYLFGSFEIDKQVVSEAKTASLAVICYNYPAIAQLRLILLSKLFGFKVIADVTEWYSTSGLKLTERVAKKIDTGLRISVINKLCDGLIVISPTFEKYYREFKGPKALIPPVFLRKNKSDFKTTSSNGGEDIKFIYMGSPFDTNRATSRAKGDEKDKLIGIISSFANTEATDRRCKLSIGGITKESFLTKYPEQTENIIRLSERIEFLGRIPHQQATKEIEKSDFSIFFRDPKRVNIYGFPSKLGESISLGTPVITNYLPNLEKIKNKGWLITTNEESLSDLIINLSAFDQTHVNQDRRKKAIEESYFQPDHHSASIGKFLEALFYQQRRNPQ